MKISELIAQLHSTLVEKGDLDVVILDADTSLQLKVEFLRIRLKEREPGTPVVEIGAAYPGFGFLSVNPTTE